MRQLVAADDDDRLVLAAPAQARKRTHDRSEFFFDLSSLSHTRIHVYTYAHTCARAQTSPKSACGRSRTLKYAILRSRNYSSLSLARRGRYRTLSHTIAPLRRRKQPASSPKEPITRRFSITASLSMYSCFSYSSF